MNTLVQPTPASPPVHLPGGMDAGASAAEALAAARVAQEDWARRPVSHRLKLVRTFRHLLAENAARLAEVSASARARPAWEAMTAEVLPLAEACRFLERAAAKILAPRRLGGGGRPFFLTGMDAEIRREPFGVILIIGPGNYPLLLPGVQMIQALVAGNGVLLKPGSDGGPVAQLLRHLAVSAGFPSPLIAVLPESTLAVRAAIVAQPDKVLFTGSAHTGQLILGELAPRLIPATMELSGCDAVIVRPDADLGLVARALVFGLLLNDGKTCIAPRRVFVNHRVFTGLEKCLAEVLPEATASGPVPESLRGLLAEAIAGGGRFLTGSETKFPVVMAGVLPKARLLQESVFSPVLALVTVTDDEEAVRLANDCPYALGAAIFTRDELAGRALANQMRAGFVCINDLILPTADPRLPFGGCARSGFGTTRGAEGLLELTTAKAVTVSRARFRPAFDPPQPGDEQLIRSYVQLTHGGDWKMRWHGWIGLWGALAQRRKSRRKEHK